MHGLDQYRVTDLFGHNSGLFYIGHDAVTAGHHRYVQTDRGIDGVRLVAHGLHALHRRANEVNAAIAHHIGKVSVLGQETDAWMQTINTLHLCHVEHAFRIQVGFVRRVTADANQGVLRAQLICRHRLHIGIALYQHHINVLLLRDTNQFRRSTASGMNQHFLDRPNQIF